MCLRRTRVLAAALVAGVMVAAVLSGLLRLAPRLQLLVGPVALAGAVSPLIGYRLYVRQRERARERRDPVDGCRAYQVAVVTALAVTEAAALAGIAVHLLTANPLALLGVAMHVVLAGAVWPSHERLAPFLEG